MGLLRAAACVDAACCGCLLLLLQETGPPLSRVLRFVCLSPSALEASRLIKEGGVRLNGDRVLDPTRRLLLSDFKLPQQQQQQQQQKGAAAVAVLTVGKSRLAALALKTAQTEEV